VASHIWRDEAAPDVGHPAVKMYYNSCDMAKRKQTQLNAATVLMVILGLCCFGIMFDNLLRGDGTAAPFLLIYAAFVAFILLLPTWRRNQVLQRADAIARDHIDELVRQRVMLVRLDPYGKPILDKWHSEINYFIKNHVRPTLSPSQRLLFDKDQAVAAERIAEIVKAAAKQQPMVAAAPTSMNPQEFEAFCAESLRACGWEVRLTPLSCDQGVDVIADKSGVRVVLQCKLYSKPVGNKAVQEIAAGRVHQQAHHGAVVTNGSYTASAKELAATNGIRLLHYSDLPRLEQMLSRTAAAHH
jgi:restriction system protein